MKLRVHLVSMPWSHPLRPSIQLGALHGYLRDKPREAVETRAYSAFVEIPWHLAGSAFYDLFLKGDRYQETAYCLALLAQQGVVKSKKEMEKLLAGVRFDGLDPLRDRSLKFTASDLRDLAAVTEEWIETKLVPELIVDGLNLIGFSLNHNQVYSSIFVQRYLERHHDSYPMLIMYGGPSLLSRRVGDVLADWSPSALVVGGEGESKLDAIVSTLSSSSLASPRELAEQLQSLVPGVRLASNAPDVLAPGRALAKSEVGDLGHLPLPDYTEYFDTLRTMSADDRAYAALRENTELLVEGSRGCFANCDFCGLNVQWRGFRKKDGEAVARQALELLNRHAGTRLRFVDNVCDTWAEAYADVLISGKLRFPTFIEARAHHPESFWTKLALVGVDCIQIGAEAMSEPLLRRMNKGTHVWQNVATHKYLNELGISSLSNIITHHPKSRLEDVEESKRVLEHLGHLSRFPLTQFRLANGSPLFSALAAERKRELAFHLQPDWPAEFLKHAIDYDFVVPDEIKCAAGTHEGWDGFVDWYGEGAADVRKTLRVARLDSSRVVVDDDRSGRLERVVLEGAAVSVLDACHAVQTLESLRSATALSTERLSEALAKLIGLKFVLEVQSHFVSLPLRPRDELVMNLSRSANSLQSHPAVT